MRCHLSSACQFPAHKGPCPLGSPEPAFPVHSPRSHNCGPSLPWMPSAPPWVPMVLTQSLLLRKKVVRGSHSRLCPLLSHSGEKSGRTVDLSELMVTPWVTKAQSDSDGCWYGAPDWDSQGLTSYCSRHTLLYELGQDLSWGVV